MSRIAPPTPSKMKPVKQDKYFLEGSLRSRMQELITTEDGRQLTVAQAMAERLTQIALFAESNTDAIAAQKLIYERVSGKAAIMKKEESKPLPKVVFALNDESLEKVNASRNIELEEEEDDDEAGIMVETDSGEEFIV